MMQRLNFAKGIAPCGLRALRVMTECAGAGPVEPLYGAD